MNLTRKLPRNFNGADIACFQSQLEIELPEPSLQYFPRLVCLYSNGIVVNRFKVEKQSLLYDTRLQELGGKVFLVNWMIKAFMKNRISFLKNREGCVFVTVVNEWTDNYFHWLTEVLPRLLVLRNSGINATVLLPSRYRAAYQLRSLELLEYPHKTFKANVLIGQNIYLPGRLAPYSGHVNPFLMRQLAESLKEKSNPGVRKSERIYATRKNAEKRKIENEDEVVRLLCEYGFAILSLEELTLDEQISLMQTARFFISIHGAALTNMIFCRPGTNILEFSLEKESLDKCYFNLANAMELNYYYQLCTAADDRFSYLESNLIVDLGLLQNNIEMMLNSNK